MSVIPDIEPDDQEPLEDEQEPCIQCNGDGWKLCRCGGDICICDNGGEMDCPACNGTGFH